MRLHIMKASNRQKSIPKATVVFYTLFDLLK